MKKFRIFLSLFMIGIAIIFLAAKKFMKNDTPALNEKGILSEIHYLPLGDSYTIGTGASVETSWPQLLSNQLNAEGVKTFLAVNPARNGFSTQDLIDYELPVLEKSDANFVTLLIGVNDWVRSVDKTTFEKNYGIILTAIQKKLDANKNRILLVTIPDFGVTPAGKNYSGGRDISKGIQEFNAVIKNYAAKYKLPLVDIYDISLKMKDDSTLVADDGLHPSAKEYAEWEKLIFADAKKLLVK
ncbi:MAG: SGNH/GDSL hydrolase family protein [Bacteroidia bacterium]|nr:SGNH/GDSL hydrolase family protein [Bacteroidia bacterium]